MISFGPELLVIEMMGVIGSNWRMSDVAETPEGRRRSARACNGVQAGRCEPSRFGMTISWSQERVSESAASEKREGAHHENQVVLLDGRVHLVDGAHAIFGDVDRASKDLEELGRQLAANGVVLDEQHARRDGPPGDVQGPVRGCDLARARSGPTVSVLARVRAPVLRLALLLLAMLLVALVCLALLLLALLLLAMLRVLLLLRRVLHVLGRALLVVLVLGRRLVVVLRRVVAGRIASSAVPVAAVERRASGTSAAVHVIPTSGRPGSAALHLKVAKAGRREWDRREGATRERGAAREVRHLVVRLARDLRVGRDELLRLRRGHERRFGLRGVPDGFLICGRRVYQGLRALGRIIRDAPASRLTRYWMRFCMSWSCATMLRWKFIISPMTTW